MGYREDFKIIMDRENITFFEAVCDYFLSKNAFLRFRWEYADQLKSQIDYLCEQEDEIVAGLTDGELVLVKDALEDKINQIQSGKYDAVFVKVFKEEIKQEIEMSEKYAKEHPDAYGELRGFVLGGMTPDEYLNELFEGSPLFFFDLGIIWEAGKPTITLDIDRGKIEWQPFD
jgi:hypothetical protein